VGTSLDKALAPKPVEPSQEVSCAVSFDSQLTSPQVPHNHLSSARPAAIISSTRARANVSSLRRENEIFRLIEEAGGIVNTHTKSFYDSHKALVDSLIQSGGVASGSKETRLDKRTLESTCDAMASKGRIKVLRTTITGPSGLSKPVSVVYLPNKSEPEISSFLYDLSQSHPNNTLPSIVARKVQGPLEYEVSYRAKLKNKARRAEKDRKDNLPLEDLFSYEDDTVRQMLLTERTTLAQSYGTIIAKFLRVRELHLIVYEAFERADQYDSVVSGEDRIIDLASFCADLPLSHYCSFVPPMAHNEELTQYLASGDGRNIPVKNLPSQIHDTLQFGRPRARTRFLEIMDTLYALNLVTPLRVSSENGPIVVPSKTHNPVCFEKFPLEVYAPNNAAPNYWQFHREAPLHHWAVSETAPPFLVNISIQNLSEATRFWPLLKDASLSKSFRVLSHEPGTSGTDNPPCPNKSTIGRMIRRKASWTRKYVFTWHQMQCLRRFLTAAGGQITPLDEDDGGEATIKKISWITSAPVEAVSDWFQTTHENTSKEMKKAKSRIRAEQEARVNREASEAKALLAQKAAEAKSKKEHDWEELLKRVHPGELNRAAAMRIKNVRTRFLQSARGSDREKWEKEIVAALKEAEMAIGKLLTVKKKPPSMRNVGPPLLGPPPDQVSYIMPPQKAVRELIEQQKTLVGNTAPMKRTKGERRRTNQEFFLFSPHV
jgi:oxalate---CoA ligase